MSVELCRFTVVTPTTYADVAVPETARVCELLPRLVEHSGDRDLVGGAVVLQRLGEDPFEPDQTVRGAGVRDGETLHLRRGADPIPPILFDDLVDGVGRAVTDGLGRWSRPLLGSWVMYYGAVPLVLGLTLLVAEPPGTGVAVTAGVMAAVLALAAGAAARAFGDRQLALIFGSLAPLYAGACAWALGAMWATGAGRWPPASEQVAVTAAAALGVSLLVGRLVGELWPALGVGSGAALVATISALASSLWAAPVALNGATVAVVLVLIGPRLPTVAYLLAGLAPPDLAQEPADLQSEIVTPLVGNEVLAQGRRADSHLTVLVAATGLTAGVALAVAALGPRPVRVVAALAAAGLLLRSRLLRNQTQRLALIAAGLVGVMALGVRFVYGFDGDARLAVGSVVSVAATSAAVVVCRLLFPARLSPVWGRGADLAETAVAVASLPLLLWCHGLFAFARGLAG